MKNSILIISFILLSAANLFADKNSEALQKYHEASIAYQKLDFPKSIKLYEELIKSDNISSSVYYNLGNSYFKNGNFAKAILNYERALKLNPDDEDADFNLKIASLKVVDKIESVPEIFYKKWITRFSSMFSSFTWTLMLVIFTWLLFASAALYVTGQTVSMKKIAFIIMLAFVFLTAITLILASKSYSASYKDEKAIVMSSSVYIKSSPDDKGNDLFILHEGTKVEVLDQLNEWKKIRIANGSVGWMKADEMEKI